MRHNFLSFCYISRVWRTDGQAEFLSLDRVYISCSAVKTMRKSSGVIRVGVTRGATQRGSEGVRAAPGGTC